jgi:glutathione S-transferase
MLHFFHHPLSPFSRKVFFLLEEAGRPFDLRTVALETRQHRTPDYLAVNPSGRVPTISDGEFNLSESNAILRYLVRRFELHRVYPVGLQEQATVDMWWEFCSNHINRPMMDLAWHKLLVQKYGGKSDAAIIAKAESSLARDLPVLERHLLGRHYLVGHDLTLADINLMPFAAYAKDLLKSDEFPAFQAWTRLVGSRQAWRNVVAYSGNNK